MRRRILGLVLCLAVLCGIAPAAYAADAGPVEAPAVSDPAVPVDVPEETPVESLAPVESPDPVESPAPAETPAAPPIVYDDNSAELRVDGVPLETLRATMYSGTAYVSLPLATAALRPGTTYAWEDDRVVVRGEGLVLSAKLGNCYLEVNGRCLFIPDGVKRLETGDTLVPARVLARALGAQITWDGAVNLTSGGAVLAPAETFYDPQAVDLLARVICHESGNQPFLGQIAVGNVILNRVKSPAFPSTIYDVIYEPNQFPNATSREPDAEAVLAAKLCLDGAMVAENAYYFNGAGKPCWASQNKTQVAVIGGHAFYG